MGGGRQSGKFLWRCIRLQALLVRLRAWFTKPLRECFYLSWTWDKTAYENTDSGNQIRLTNLPIYQFPNLHTTSGGL